MDKPTIEEMNEIYLKWAAIRKEAEEVFYFCLDHSSLWRDKVPNPDELGRFDFIGDQVSVAIIDSYFDSTRYQVHLFPAKYLFAPRCDILIWLEEEIKEASRKIEEERERKRKIQEGKRKAKELKRLAELKAKYEGVSR